MPGTKTDTYAYIKGVDNKFLPNGRRLYNVLTNDGTTYATFRPEIAEKARLFEGHEAKILYTVVQKGQYENLWIDDIQEPEHIAAPEPEPLPKLNAADKDVQIARAVALKAAVQYLSTPEQEREPLANLLDLFDTLTESLLGR